MPFFLRLEDAAECGQLLVRAEESGVMLFVSKCCGRNGHHDQNPRHPCSVFAPKPQTRDNNGISLEKRADDNNNSLNWFPKVNPNTHFRFFVCEHMGFVTFLTVIIKANLSTSFIVIFNSFDRNFQKGFYQNWAQNN